MNANPTRSTVRVDPDRLSVVGWSTAEASVLAAARAANARGEDLVAWLSAVVLAGTAAVTAAGAGSDLARVDAALARLDREVDSSLQTMLDRSKRVSPRRPTRSAGTSPGPPSRPWIGSRQESSVS